MPDESAQLNPDEQRILAAYLAPYAEDTRFLPLPDLAASLDLPLDHLIDILSRPHLQARIEAALALAETQIRILTAPARHAAIDTLHEISRTLDPEPDDLPVLAERRRAAVGLLRSLAPRTRRPTARDDHAPHPPSPRSALPTATRAEPPPAHRAHHALERTQPLTAPPRRSQARDHALTPAPTRPAEDHTRPARESTDARPQPDTQTRSPPAHRFAPPF